MAATLWVALGGALGSISRFWLGIGMAHLSKNLPWGTIAINIAGSFIIAFFGALTIMDGKYPASENVRLFVMIGVCGGFTTFSSFSLQSFEFFRHGDFSRAFINIALSVVLCLAATALGFYAGQKMSGVNHEIAQAKIEEEA